VLYCTAPVPAWLGFEIDLRLREPERILHEGCLDGVADQGELDRFIERETQHAVDVLALGLAVIAIALGLKVHGIHHVVDDALITGRLQRIALGVESTVLRGAVDEVAGGASSVNREITPPEELP
jgi:hypothetical protein